MEKQRDLIEEGKQAYQEWRDNLWANPEYRAIYEAEAAKKELWLQLVEARQKAGLTQAELARRLGVSQAQVARMEKRGYDAYTLNSLRRYVQALGRGFSLDVEVRQNAPEPVTEPVTAFPFEQAEADTSVSAAQAAILAKEAWDGAEAEVQSARNTAHSVAASISFLSQEGGLSNELMAELLRKQSEANKALTRAQNAVRVAYEKFVQAQEEAERSEGRPIPKIPRILLSEDDVSDLNTQMYADHPRKV